MADATQPQTKTDGQSPSWPGFQPPQLNLPKGGGAIRGMGEKFTANPVTGTGSMTIPILCSSARSGFGPKLSLSYDSGSGNGPFGFGWSLDLPSITRRTDKGIPQYRDSEESDTFILSGAEDLVPILVPSGDQWVRESLPPRTIYGIQYAVQRYRPRIEGLFARIERWINLTDPGDSFWRSISKENITTWYGKTADSRIADPSDATRIFSWLICETYDDKGNVILYNHKDEDSSGVVASQSHEFNRSDLTRSSQRYIKSISYGNQSGYFPSLSDPTAVALPTNWNFQLVFDYGEHDLLAPIPEDSSQPWMYRLDPFSSYRSGFEVRTYRLCRRVLTFHNFPDQSDLLVDCLVRSTDLVHSSSLPSDPSQPFYSYLLSATQSSYIRNAATSYQADSLPPVEFGYTEAVIDETVHDVDPTSVTNVPYGIDGNTYRWIDLDGEGLSGVLIEQGGGWFYKSNLSPINQQMVDGKQITMPCFGPVQSVRRVPPMAAINGGDQQLMDVSGNGHLDIVEFSGPVPGYFERTTDEDWEPFKKFRSIPVVNWRDPNLKFIDLTGDGFPDLLISESYAFTWHRSLTTEGFGPGHRVAQFLDEEKGPKLVFSDSTETIFIADMSGDGLTDLVRIRNGEVCYWPNLGYGGFGSKITMDQSPSFDHPDQFDGRRIHLADIDGSGTSDILYFSNRGMELYFNQSGNGWGTARELQTYPAVDGLSTATVFDLLGNGTACLVWSSSSPGNARRPMRYIDLMGGQKPHLLVSVTNNLGAETVIEYAPSTRFYVADKLAGTPWLTRLPFPIYVVERTETYDYIGRNRFVTRYAYHHGYYDGVERDFRGFGRVDQWDTEELSSLSNSTSFPESSNQDPSSNVPPTLTKTWFHTGAMFGESVSTKQFKQEYYSEGDLSDDIPGQGEDGFESMLLPDTILPETILLPGGTTSSYNLSEEEMREACRALRGSILRQEIYALDGTDAADRPYSASERNYTIEILQPQEPNLYGVFATYSRETIDYHYERKLYNLAGESLTLPSQKLTTVAEAADPRVTHTFTLAVDVFGNVLQSAAISYGRRHPDPNLTPADQSRQFTLSASYTQNSFTNAILNGDSNRTPMPAQSTSYQLFQVTPSANDPDVTNLIRFPELQSFIQTASDGNHDLPYQDFNPTGLSANEPYRRLLGQSRTVYRPDDMGAAAGSPQTLLPLGTLESLALPGCSYKLAFTLTLIADVYVRNQVPLLPTPGTLLESLLGDGGGYHLGDDGNWWTQSGRIYYLLSPSIPDELTEARSSCFLPRSFVDPFGNRSMVDYDEYGLFPVQTTDALGNTSSAIYDYRVLAPYQLTDPNGNHLAVGFDVLGMVVATAVMGKAPDTPTQKQPGDLLDGFVSDLTQAQIDAFRTATDPHVLAAGLLGNATTRIVYDIHRFFNTRTEAPNDWTQWQPTFAATLARETHVSDLAANEQSKIQIAFSYSDGFGREIQKKIQAEPGPTVDSGPNVDPRWVGSGWTIFNNKGKPVRQYEPFFTAAAAFEFAAQAGVSSILFYDPVERVVATLHPDQTYEKVVFDPWQQQTWDVNDTVLQTNPAGDSDVGDFFKALPDSDYLPTWYALRTDPAYASEAANLWPDKVILAKENEAAAKAAAHANTPSTAYFDTLGRPFLTIADNAAAGKYAAHVELDIQGFQRSVTDALDRKVMAYDYDILGNRIHQASMEAAERWTLSDVTGKPIRAWDTRGHNFRTEYDALRRPTGSFVQGTDAVNSDPRTVPAEVQIQKTVYGEGLSPDLNLNQRVYKVFDGAGIVISSAINPTTQLEEAYDFKGNLLRGSRQFVDDYKALPDWSAVTPPILSADVFSGSTQYDAMNRATSAVSPDGSITTPTYNEANLLETVSVDLQGATTATAFVTNIDYDAKGRRTRIDYRNGASTSYTYDPLTLRLNRLTTTRSSFPANQQTVQDLQYVYDPTGNITHIQDDADIQHAVFFSNQRVEPSNDYTYDATYRLIQASGREQLGLDNNSKQLAATPGSYNDIPRAGLLSPSDGNALGTYTEQYNYDAVGNFLQFIHKSSSASSPGWTRNYNYSEASLLEPANMSNRLSSTGFGETPPSETYKYDLHGSMIDMPQLSAMQWDFKDALYMTQRQAVNATDADGVAHSGEQTYYVYDGSGQRVRKVTQSAAGVKKKERFYIGGYEVYREYSLGQLTLERETLHVMDDKQRVALVETRTQGTDAAAAQLIRYQFSNHLGSASLELDGSANVISYEEYCPYGNTSYQAYGSAVEINSKRYRYTGMERDEETGLSYHGARYLATWLGRWISTDPDHLVDGTCLYRYCRNNPIVLSDANGTDGKAPLPGLLGNDPKVGKLWEKATAETLGPGLKTTTYEGTVNAFKAGVAARKAAFGGWLGSNSKTGTAINYARTSYSAVRTRFGKLAADAGVSFDGVQLHHTFDHLAENPVEALNTTNLYATRGNAGTLGSGHNLAHKIDDAYAAGSPNPTETALNDLRSRGIEPNAPELGPEFRNPQSGTTNLRFTAGVTNVLQVAQVVGDYVTQMNNGDFAGARHTAEGAALVLGLARIHPALLIGLSPIGVRAEFSENRESIESRGNWLGEHTEALARDALGPVASIPIVGEYAPKIVGASAAGLYAAGESTVRFGITTVKGLGKGAVYLGAAAYKTYDFVTDKIGYELYWPF